MTDRRGLIRINTVRLLSLLWLFTLAGIANGEADGVDGPQEWLERMAGAANTHSYRGTLVHMCGGKVDIVQVVHRADNGQVTERINALDTAGREIIRNPEEVMCILPDQKRVMLDQRGAGSSAPALKIAHMPGFSLVNTNIYRLEIRESERIAGHDTRIIAVSPVDQHRYGYRLWLDSTRAVPLKFELMSESGEPLEQTMYTEILFDDSLQPADVAPMAGMDDYVWQRPAAASAQGSSARADVADVSGGWECGDMPVGFKLTIARSQIAEDAKSTMEHLVYSDGLASVSVFIEGGVIDAEEQIGVSQVGATIAYTTVVDGYLVTAVGGVPLGTAKMMAMSVRPISAAR